MTLNGDIAGHISLTDDFGSLGAPQQLTQNRSLPNTTHMNNTKQNKHGSQNSDGHLPRPETIHVTDGAGKQRSSALVQSNNISSFVVFFFFFIYLFVCCFFVIRIFFLFFGLIAFVLHLFFFP